MTATEAFAELCYVVSHDRRHIRIARAERLWAADAWVRRERSHNPLYTYPRNKFASPHGHAVAVRSAYLADMRGI